SFSYQYMFDYSVMYEDVTSSYVRTTSPFNLSGQPALTVPCGFDRDGLPIGLQIAGRPFDEVTVLRIGAAYEATTTWSEQRPPVRVETQ
ncbi:MAG: amidase family protein, partial [bacterium]|nr:amidase family protein [bacterium]